jgi:membrane-bound serine protease (ClpP class)
MDNSHLNWAILLIAIAIVLFFIEFIVPSGGILAVCAFLSLAVGVFFLYKVDTTIGLIGAIVSVGSLPFLFALGIKVLPSTPFYRRLLLKDVPRAGLGEHGIAGATGRERARALIGEQGQAVTDLKPVGTCIIKGERMDCLSAAGQIKSGARVRVIFADGIQVKVKVDE